MLLAVAWSYLSDEKRQTIETGETNDAADGEEEIGQLFEGGPVEELARGAGQDADLHNHAGKDECGELHEANDSRRPTKANGRLKPVENFVKISLRIVFITVEVTHQWDI